MIVFFPLLTPCLLYRLFAANQIFGLLTTKDYDFLGEMPNSSGDLSETEADMLKAALVESFVMLVEEWKVCNQTLQKGLEVVNVSLFMRDGGVINVVKGRGKKK